MKNLTKTLIALMLVLVSVLSVTACTSEKIFEVEGLTICLDDSFEVVDGENTVNIVSKDVIFVALKEEYSILPEEVNYLSGSTEYADVIIKINGYNATPKTVNGAAHFEFDDESYYNYFVILKSTDSFWTCRFMCSLSVKDKYQEKIKGWGSMIF